MSDELARVRGLRDIADDLQNGYVSGELRWAADEIERLRDTILSMGLTPGTADAGSDQDG
jgi:hypothetical protein